MRLVQRQGASKREPRSIGGPSRRMRHELSILLAAALAIVLFAGLLTQSRGGAAALAVTACVMLFGGRAARVVHNGHLLGAAVIGMAVVALLSVKGYDELAQRLGDYATGSLESLDGAGARRKIWAANLAASQPGTDDRFWSRLPRRNLQALSAAIGCPLSTRTLKTDISRCSLRPACSARHCWPRQFSRSATCAFRGPDARAPDAQKRSLCVRSGRRVVSQRQFIPLSISYGTSPLVSQSR